MTEKIKAIIGEAYTEEIGQKLEATLTENGGSAELELANTRIAELEAELSEAGTVIEGFKAMDIDSIKAAADDWKQKAEQAEKDAASKIFEMQFETALTSAIGTVKGKNIKAISALLDMDSLKTSKNQNEAIQQALAAVQADAAYLFESGETPPPYAAGTGTMNLFANDSMATVRAAAGLTKEGV